MKETLILLTGAFRLDNLLHIAKTINEQHGKYDNFNIRWLICKDQYNSFGNIDKTIKYLNDTNIKYQIIDTGKPNQPNYGGDLYNDPLKKYVEQEKLDNPWIYILDDDNILHPRLLEIFNNCINNNFYGNKGIITTINKWHCGHNREIDNDIFLLRSKSNMIREWFLFDPSSVIIRYNVIKEYGFFSSDFLYDFYWLNPLIYQEVAKNNVIWYNDYDKSFGRHLVGSYHNGLVQYDEVDKFINRDTFNIDIILYDSLIECPQMVPILSKESKTKIKNIIYEELKKYKE